MCWQLAGKLRNIIVFNGDTDPSVQIIAAGAPLTGKPLGWVNGTSKDGSETLMLEPPPEESALRH